MRALNMITPHRSPVGRLPQKGPMVAAVYLVALVRKAPNPTIQVSLRRIPEARVISATVGGNPPPTPEGAVRRTSGNQRNLNQKVTLSPCAEAVCSLGSAGERKSDGRHQLMQRAFISRSFAPPPRPYSRALPESGQTQNHYFFPALPESGPPGRHSTTGESVRPPATPARPAMSAAELRLRAWTELPQRHRDEVCRQIRRRCEAFVASIRVEKVARQAEADGLVSEVVAHLLRAPSTGRKQPPMNDASPQTPSGLTTDAGCPWPWLAKGRIDERDPAGDARATWLLDETCNRQALFHRFEDMRRRDRGGKWDGTGYPMVAVDHQTIENLSGGYDRSAE